MSHPVCTVEGCACGCHRVEVHGALDAELIYLSPRERQFFDALLDAGWVEHRDLARRMFGWADISERHHIRVLVSRTRGKLREHAAPWRIETTLGAVRLVCAEAPADAA